MNDARHDLLRSVATLRRDDVVLGQYDGYLETEGVDPLSTTETYIRATMRIDNDRWRNVMFTLISGKALADSRVSVAISFRAAQAESSRMQQTETVDGSVDPTSWLSRGALCKTSSTMNVLLPTLSGRGARESSLERCQFGESSSLGESFERLDDEVAE